VHVFLGHVINISQKKEKIVSKIIVDLDPAWVSYYNKQGKLHRDDGPAVECATGDKAWYKNGLKHREDGPAVEYSSGHKEW
jgi:hypothetical protein